MLKRIKATPDHSKIDIISKKNVEVFSEQIDFFQRIRLAPMSKALQHTLSSNEPVD